MAKCSPPEVVPWAAATDVRVDRDEPPGPELSEEQVTIRIFQLITTHFLGTLLGQSTEHEKS